ncbi:hypothetical protein [Pseudonocardia endophytica]|uniref:Uncharacterized protein n=1 Tax=Pseudonocardia endophytica TaxID=401976 RepID=A0A4R1HMI3_PSEEN|nr:hypothetical protein [Pseudonocardia endophytica]TCK22253.1 hypothetical protein EV378_6253 [Pseudonocardia endophytica]
MTPTRMLTRITLGAVAAAAAAVVAAPMASAGPPTYRSLQECQDAGFAQVGAAGGAFSGKQFECEKTYGVPAGVAGCPTTAGSSGCIGEYYILRTKDA